MYVHISDITLICQLLQNCCLLSFVHIGDNSIVLLWKFFDLVGFI